MRKALLAFSLLAQVRAPAWAQTLFSDSFSLPDGVITNEFAYENPTVSGIRLSPAWETTNGSLFASGYAGWTGVPDDKAPDLLSTKGNSSSAFRLRSRRADFGDVSVSLRLLNGGLSSTAKYPPVAWDGAHIWLRYQSEYQLYAVSVNRRDNKVVIKKKTPGGSSNGGAYYDLTLGISYPVPYAVWQSIKAAVRTNADGSVLIELYAGGKLVARAVDDGRVGGAPIRLPGRIGLRGDNADLKFDDLVVSQLPDLTPPVLSGVGSTSVKPDSAEVVWNTNEPADSQVDYGRTTAYGSVTVLAAARELAHRVYLPGLAPATQYFYRVRSRDAAGNMSQSRETHAFITGGSVDTRPPSVTGVGSTGVTASEASIVWRTDEPADSQVEYGRTRDYGTWSPRSATLAFSHRLVLLGLTAGAQYFYRVRSRDAAGNTGLSTQTHAFQTLSGDTTAPVVLTAGSSNVAETSADVVWTTDEASDSQVEYGLTSAYGALSARGSALVASHRITLTGLGPGTRYYYRLRSRDAAGNLRIDGVVHAFTTKAPAVGGG